MVPVAPARAAARRPATCAGCLAARPPPLRAAHPPPRRSRRAYSVGDDAGAAPAAAEALEAGDDAEAAGAAEDPSLPPAAASDARLPARLLRFATGRWDLARVACAPSPDALLQLSSDTLTLTPSCVAAVLSRLLRLLRPGASQPGGDAAVDWTADPRFRQLLAVAEKQLAVAKRPRNLFLVFFAVCALYGHGPGRSMRPTGRRFQLPPRTFVARAVAVAGKHGFLPALLPKELAFLLQACVQVRAPVAADWLRDMWPASGGSEWASLELFSQHDLFSLFVALRRLKIEPPEHWQDAMWRSPAARAWDADAKTSALYLAGMPQVLRPPPAQWLEPYWEESCRAAEAGKLSQGAMVRVMSACGRLHVTPPEAWLDQFWRSCARELSTGQMTFDQLPNVLFNAAVMQLKPPDAFNAVLFEAAVADGDELSEDQFDALLLAVRRMGLQPPKGWELKLLLRGGAGANNAR